MIDKAKAEVKKDLKLLKIRSIKTLLENIEASELLIADNKEKIEKIAAAKTSKEAQRFGAY